MGGGRDESSLHFRAEDDRAQEKGGGPSRPSGLGTNADHEGRREASNLHAVRAQIRTGGDHRRKSSEKRAEEGKPRGRTDRAINRSAYHEASQLTERQKGNLSDEQLRRTAHERGKVVHIRWGSGATSGVKKGENGIEGKSPEKGACRAAHPDTTMQRMQRAETAVETSTDGAASSQPEQGACEGGGKPRRKRRRPSQ